MAPPKRARTSSSAPFDTNKFVSQVTSERYRDSLVRKTSIPERGFHTNEYGVMHIVTDRSWFNFAQQPGASVTAIVREFYANALEPRDGRVFVRGKWVLIDRTTINQYFQLHDIENDEYQAYLEDINYEEIITELCAPGTTWKMGRKGDYVKFSQSALSRYGKAWHNFICARLMPVSHVSDVTKDRAALLYAIMTGKSIDIGRVMAWQITHSVRQAQAGLYFPSLITELCKQAGVRWDSTEEWVGPKRVIDRQLIQSYKQPAERATPDAPEPSTGMELQVVTDQPEPSRPTSQMSMEDRWDRLEDRLDHIDNNLCIMADMIQHVAKKADIDISQFPEVNVFQTDEEDDAEGDE